MVEDEVVETSDIEEDAEASQYWRSAAASARTGYARLQDHVMVDGPRSPKRRKVHFLNRYSNHIP